MKRRHAVVSLPAFAGAAALPRRARAATKIVFGYTAVTDVASVFVAAQEGYFNQRNLDVELKSIPLNSTIPAALQSDSLQIGGPTPSVLLQAVDGGLDLVVLAGGGLTSKASTAFGLVARAGSGIRGARDCAAKKIGVPALGAFLHVTFRAYLKQSGVDDHQVNFVEASFPRHGDLLRAGSIDAVVTADPFMSRITDSGVGYVAAYCATFLADGNRTIYRAAKREWVQSNPSAARAFRESAQNGAAFMQQVKNNDQVRAALGKYIKLPPEVMAKMQISPPGPLVTDTQVRFWLAMMKDQDMLKTSIDATTLRVK
jgi:NitT/TauT family transport system substrate-binding protein